MATVNNPNAGLEPEELDIDIQEVMIKAYERG